MGWGKKANNIFFYGWSVWTFFKLYGSLVLTKSDCMGAGVGPDQFLILWVVVCYPCAEREEIILSSKSLINRAKRELRTWQHFLDMEVALLFTHVT